MGIAWSIVYGILESQAPGSFVQNNESIVIETGAEEGLSEKLVYYSLVTMTTLGYGDITPATVLARRLSVIEAMMGQLYVAILVARLVALQVAHASED
jgi:voltage-gated potassium channel Kch